MFFRFEAPSWLISYDKSSAGKQACLPAGRPMLAAALGKSPMRQCKFYNLICILAD